MRYSQYKFNFYLNASHAIYINGAMGQSHPHTWEIIIKVIKSSDKFVMFNEVEKKIEEFLDGYQNSFLNDFQPFDTLNPTLENITGYFLEKFQTLLEELGWTIFYIEVGETPTRSYIISRVENNIVSNLRHSNIVEDIIDTAFEGE